MNNKRQTAVYWLADYVMRHLSMSQETIEAINQAKELEKQQLEDAFMEADYFEGLASKKDFEQYYTETYNTPQP
jgi:hypothetical protein